MNITIKVFALLIVLSTLLLATLKVDTNIHKTYYSNGTLKSIIPTLNGKGKYFYPNGAIMKEVAFKDGVPSGIEKSYYRSGKLFRTCLYKDGVLSGECKEYYESGKLKKQLFYKFGKITQTSKSFYESGELKSKINYKDGLLDGVSILYTKKTKDKI